MFSSVKLQSAASQSPASDQRIAGLLRDLATGLKQQMFFWGRDVVYPSGNLLVEYGFEKSRSLGLQGTSCYHLDWQRGRIELHGACAAWYPDHGGDGFIYIRPLGKCFAWLDQKAAIPGYWPKESFRPLELRFPDRACNHFIDWWLAYEHFIEKSLGQNHRADHYRQHKSLPRTKSWLPPRSATLWLRGLRDNPGKLKRANLFYVAK